MDILNKVLFLTESKMPHSKLADVLEREETQTRQTKTLCNGGIIKGNTNVQGVVFPGDRKNLANILWNKDSFDNHCRTCSQITFCGEVQKKNILEILQAEDHERKCKGE